jgi:cytochrome bd-type quinol oxidase subunit 2
MKSVFSWLILLVLVGALFSLALGFNAERQAERAYAQAAIIRAQSAARMDLSAALMPYAVIGVVALMAVTALTLATVALVKLGQPGQSDRPRLIERQIIMIQPGQSRREVYKMLSGGSNECE